MLEDLLYLIIFCTVFFGPALIADGIFEYIYYKMLGHDPNEDYKD